MPLELGLGARVYRRPRALLAVIVPVAVVFSLVDALAIELGLWTYDPAQTTGVDLGSLPLEEIAFFVVIPICAVLTFEAVGRVAAMKRPAVPSRESVRRRA